MSEICVVIGHHAGCVRNKGIVAFRRDREETPSQVGVAVPQGMLSRAKRPCAPCVDSRTPVQENVADDGPILRCRNVQRCTAFTISLVDDVRSPAFQGAHQAELVARRTRRVDAECGRGSLRHQVVEPEVGGNWRWRTAGGHAEAASSSLGQLRGLVSSGGRAIKEFQKL